MVRQSKQTPEHKKKTVQVTPKKPSDAAVWPCSINGCNKQFAREADLKRHQRTTKLHSVPGFACPQCDARFTRTDALRRHQKSRHNGVVIEPTDPVDRRRSTGDDPPRSSDSRSNSRSGTPESKEGPDTHTHTPLPSATVPPAGTQGYYRQHTFPGVIIPPGIVVEGHFPPGVPVSATRLHQASWPPPPWTGDGSQLPPPHMIHPGYPHAYYNTPPYYRPGTMMHPSDIVANQISNAVSSSNGESSSSRQASPVVAVDPSLDHAGMEDPSHTTDHETAVIDPLLVSPSTTNADNGESCADGPRIPLKRSSSSHAQHFPSPSACEPPNGDGNCSDSESIVRSLLSPGRDNPFASPPPLQHPLEMEQILTEDGEPMLNPAELLTQVSMSNATSTVLDLMLRILGQESLASPPPS